MKELYIDDAVVQMSVLDKQGFFSSNSGDFSFRPVTQIH